MKVFVFIAIIAVVTASPAVSSVSNSASSNVQEANEGESPAVQPFQPHDLVRQRKGAYGGGGNISGGYGGSSASSGVSIQAPPCASNYLFSCQPNLAPVACSPSSSSGSYGSHGSYSAPVPSFVAPVPVPNNGYGYPQGFSVPNQFYHY